MHILGIVLAVFGAVLIIVLNVLHIRYYGRFVEYLKINHPEHWESIGSPVQFEDEPAYGSIGYSKYFSSQRYAELENPELSKLGDQIRGKRKWMFVCLVVLVVGVAIANGDIG